MTKKELIKSTHQKFSTYLQKDIACAVGIVFDSIREALKNNERVEIRGFGNFTLRERKSRTGRNPKSGAQVHLKDRMVPFFKTGKDLRLKVDGKNDL